MAPLDNGHMHVANDESHVPAASSFPPHLLRLAEVPDNAADPLIAGGPYVKNHNVVVPALEELGDNMLT